METPQKINRKPKIKIKMKNTSTWSAMMNTWKRVLWLWEDLITKHDVLRSFSWIRKQEVAHINIPDTGVHFYIGSLAESISWFYNDDFIKDSLDTMLKVLPDDAPIHLDMAGSVSILLNRDIPALAIEDQVSRVREIVNMHYKKHAHRIHIHNLDDRHQALLTSVSENWISGLSEEPPENSWSLYLAHKLYKATQESRKLLKKVISTKPDKLKASDEPSDNDYYALIEVAMRLQDLLDGISLQWWESRQKRYDSIMLDVLNNRYEWSHSLDELKALFSDVDSNELQRLYFDKNNYGKLRDEKNLLNWIRWLSLSLLVVWWSGIWYMKYDKAAQQDRIQNAVTEIIDANFQYKNTDLYHGYPEHQSELAPSQEVMKISKNISHQFIARYGAWKADEKFIETLVLNEINRDWVVPKVRVTWLHSYESFIDNQFIPNNSTTLTSLWIDIERLKYRGNHLKTYFRDFGWDVPPDFKWNIQHKHSYTLSWGVMSYQVGKLNCFTSSSRDLPGSYICPSPDLQDTMVARRLWSDDKFSFDLWKEVAFDYLNSYKVKQYTRYVWNIMNEVYGQTLGHEEDTDKILKLLHDGVISFDEIQKPDFLQTISLIETYFLDEPDENQSFVSWLQNTLWADIEDIEGKDIYARHIWTLTLNDGTIHYIYSAIVNNTRYIITSGSDMWRYYQHVSGYSFEYSRPTIKQIQELL